MSIPESGESEKREEWAGWLRQDLNQTAPLISFRADLKSMSSNLAISEQRIATVDSALRSLCVDRWQIRRGRGKSVKTVMQTRESDKCYPQICRKDSRCGA